MASEASKPRVVKCPKCLRLLMEIPDVPVYKCGVCGTILQAKARHAGLQQNPPCSTSEHSSRGNESNDLSEEGDPPSCRANADMEAGSAPEIPYPGEHSAATGVDTISVASGTHSKHGSVTESVISEQEVLDGIPGISQICNAVPSIAGSSRSYELGVSSGDDISGRHERYRRLSRRTFRYRNPSESSGGEAKDQTEVDSAGKNQTAPPNEMRHDASNFGISGLMQRSSSRDSARTSETDDRSRSASFFSLQNEMESDHLSSASRSPSRDSTSAEDLPCDVLSGISSSRLGNLQRDREAEPAIQSFEAEIATLRERSSLDKISLEAEIADRERSISDLKSCIEKFAQERSLLESKLADQEHYIEKLNAAVATSSQTFLAQKTRLESEILTLSEAHASLETKLAALEEEKAQLELEKAEACASNADELNRNLDSFKLKHDMLASERDELGAQVSTLIVQLEHRDTHLQQLHAESARLFVEAEDARRRTREVDERAKQLEEEVERQRAMLSEGAEKKREAIRQLCCTLEHYRDGYNQLRRRLLLDHRRPPPVVLSS